MLCRSPEITGDGLQRLESLRRLLHEGTLAEGKYSLIGPLFATPLWYVDRALEDSAWTWCSRFNQIVFCVGLAALYFLLRKPLGASVTRKFLLILVSASMFPRYVQNFYGEVFTVILVGVGLLALARGVTRWGVLSIAVGAANARATLVRLGIASVIQVWQTKKLRYLALVIIGAGLVLGETWLRFGHPLANPYAGDAGFATHLPYSGRPGFSYPFGFGLMSVLFSFGKGIVFFAPGLLLWPRASQLEHAPQVRQAFRLWLGFLIGLLVVYSKWWAWYGGWCWGPRFFLLAAIPASLALAMAVDRMATASVGKVALIVAVLLLSVWVSVNAAVFDLTTLAIGQVENYRYEAFCWYVPEFSVLWYPFVSADTEWSAYVLPLAYGVGVFGVLAWPGVGSLLTESSKGLGMGARQARALRP